MEVTSMSVSPWQGAPDYNTFASLKKVTGSGRDLYIGVYKKSDTHGEYLHCRIQAGSGAKNYRYDDIGLFLMNEYPGYTCFQKIPSVGGNIDEGDTYHVYGYPHSHILAASLSQVMMAALFDPKETPIDGKFVVSRHAQLSYASLMRLKNTHFGEDATAVMVLAADKKIMDTLQARYGKRINMIASPSFNGKLPDLSQRTLH